MNWIIEAEAQTPIITDRWDAILAEAINRWLSDTLPGTTWTPILTPYAGGVAVRYVPQWWY